MSLIDRLRARRGKLRAVLRRLKRVDIAKRFRGLRRRLSKLRTKLRHRIKGFTARIKDLQEQPTDRLSDGPDVSSHQGRVDWKAVRGRYRVAFAKATEGRTYTDPEFFRNFVAMREAGLRAGFYHFARPDNNSAVAEVANFVSAVRQAGGRFIGFEDWRAGKPGVVGVLDFEHEPYSAGWAASWGEEFKRLTGVKALIYGGGYSLNPVLSALDKFSGVWLAAYVTDWKPYFNGDDSLVKFWQFTSSGSCPGVNGRCDLNHYLKR